MPTKRDVLSFNYDIQFGTLAVSRGKEDGLSLFAWEPIPECTDKRCPLNLRCHFKQRGGKCKVISGIVRAALTSILTNYGPKLNNAQRNRIGTHLIPLYVDLARMFVYEASLSSVHFIDKHGSPKIDPVYKEKRETVRSIELMWKQIGLADIPVGEVEIGNWYEEMEAEAQQEIETNRKEKIKPKPKLMRRNK